MTKIDSNLLIDQEWTGTFFPPDRQDLSFAGRLKYSPTNGLRLEFARPMDMTDRSLKWNYLLGHTSTGEPLTLVGKFCAEGNGISMMYGMSYWTSTGYPFHYVIFGHHFDDKVTFDTFEFDIAGVQDFFAPDGMKSQIPYSKADIVTANCSVGVLKVIHSGKFEFVNNDLMVHFHSEDIEALNELQQAYIEVRTRHPEFRPYLKRTLDYLFRFVPQSDMTIQNAYSIIDSVTDLFAILFFEPTKLAGLSATARDEDGKPCQMMVFPSMVNDKATIERSQAKRNYSHLPLNNGDVNLGLLITKWLDQRDRYLAISSMLQSKVNVISDHEIRGGPEKSDSRISDSLAQLTAA